MSGLSRDFLKELGLEKEAVDSIMSEHGKTIEENKKMVETLTTERDTVKTQLTDANKTIEGFGDYEATKKQAEEYKTKFEQSQTEFNSKLDKIELDKMIEDSAKEFGAKSLKAIKPYLDLDAIVTSKNRKEDIKKAFESIKSDEENKFLFSSTEPIDNPAPVKETGNKPIGDLLVDKIRSAAGLKSKE